MLRPELCGAFRDVGREWLDAHAQIGHELPHDRDRIPPAPPGIHQDLRVRACREDQRLLARTPEGGHRCRVVRVAGVEQGNDDARVENDYRHSRRSFFRAAFG